MDLKKFIKETISSIADATAELQEQYADKAVIINPLMNEGEMKQRLDAPAYKFQRVETVQFDVAVTAASETEGEAGARLKVWSVDIGGRGTHSVGSESVSRVQFSISMALPISAEEQERVSESGKKATGGSTPGGPGVVG